MEPRRKRFLQSVALILKATGLAPRYLKVELTESILMHDAELSVSALEALRGCSLPSMTSVRAMQA